MPQTGDVSPSEATYLMRCRAGSPRQYLTRRFVALCNLQKLGEGDWSFDQVRRRGCVFSVRRTWYRDNRHESVGNERPLGDRAERDRDPADSSLEDTADSRCQRARGRTCRAWAARRRPCIASTRCTASPTR